MTHIGGKLHVGEGMYFLDQLNVALVSIKIRVLIMLRIESLKKSSSYHIVEILCYQIFALGNVVMKISDSFKYRDAQITG